MQHPIGHGHEEDCYRPTCIASLASACKVVKIECSKNRTYVITNFGCVLTFGAENSNNKICHKTPFVIEYLLPWRIYQIAGAKDYTVAVGVENKGGLVPKPKFDLSKVLFFFVFFFLV